MSKSARLSLRHQKRLRKPFGRIRRPALAVFKERAAERKPSGPVREVRIAGILHARSVSRLWRRGAMGSEREAEAAYLLSRFSISGSR